MPLAFQQDIKFRHVPEERIDETNFTGGLITDAHETKLQQNQSPDMANVLFNDTGSIKTRNGYLRYNNDPIGAASDTANTGASTGTLSISAVGDYVSQTFIASGAVEVLQVDLFLEMATSGEEQLARVEIWSTDSGAPDTLTSQSQILLISGTSETEYSFRFKEPVSLSAATTYAIVLKPFVRGSVQSVNEIEVHHTGNDYADGSVYTSDDAGGSWTEDSAKDLRFDVYAGGDTGGTGLIRFYGTGGLQQLIAKFGSTLYRGNDSTGVMTTISLGSGGSLAAANFIDWTIANDTLLVVDDSSRIQKYRGSTNANYTTGTISVTNGSATVTGSGTSWDTATNAVAGEYIQLPDDKWYLITVINSDTSLTVEVEYQGSNASGESYTISPWGEVQGKLNTSTPPGGLVRPAPKFIENHTNRIWTLEGNTLRFSVLDTSVDEEHFNDWDTANNAGSIIIPSGKGDSGTGLYSLGNNLYVFQRRAIWGLYGNSPGNFELRNITNEIGMLDKRTLVEYNDILAFLSDDGVILFDGSNVKNISDGLINNLINSWANKTSPAAVLWDNKYMLAGRTSGATYNDEAVFFDFTRQIWGKFENVFASAWSAWEGGTDSGQVYFTSSNQGTVYQWDTGGHDDGYELITRYDTPSLNFGSGTNDKSIKKFYLQQLALGDWDMDVKQFSDINATELNSEINLAPGSSSLWDVMEWDVDSWSAEGSLITTRIAEFQGLAKYFRFRFEQEGYDEGIEILVLTTTARTRRLT